ncbi:MAG: universal stress protein [Bacteroidota bacterium]
MSFFVNFIKGKKQGTLITNNNIMIMKEPMYEYQNLLIPLNLTSMDDVVLKFASQISGMSNSEKAHFIHVKQPVDVPTEILEAYPEMISTDLKDRMSKLQKSVKTGFKGYSRTQTLFDVKEGRALETLIEQIAERDIDLVLVGRKKIATDTRKLPIKLAQKAPCSVLIIPEESGASILNILVPIDFSDYCANALEVAVNYAIANDISTIHCLHVFQLPIGYSKTGKSEEEFTEIMMKNARKSYDRFIKKVDLKGVKVKPEFMLHNRPAQVIQNQVEEKHIDMIILGTRGRSTGAGLLLGSVTENIILNTRVPIFAVKKKGTGLSVLEVLMKYV